MLKLAREGNTVLLPKTKIIRDKHYRMWVASLPCCITGISGQTQAAHISRLGMGIKASDSEIIPMSWPKHQEQTLTGSEPKFWSKYGKTMAQVYELANGLWVRQYDDDQALLILSRFKRGIIHS